ncbi:hypothetical protein J0A67_04795 [Algoriphagus aestuariicola]|uniref:Uncharacterized protein n=1 Tax=Algoriphagus aestuariicola TaxID=1852016 RepID=A0ABS3BPI7_9BACT|nr:hypothetical protein [Algoriphagus aestuariicola]MBN7800166.1 hypothetical protein [Algoriphagus aestuariicola]
MSYTISLNKAANLVLAFLKEPALKELAVTEAIGGTVSKDAIKKYALVFKGSMGWYCRNLTGDTAFPKLFMAFEDGEYEVAKVPSSPKKEELTCPENTFVFERGHDLASVKEMLLTDVHAPVVDKSITRAEVNQFTNLMPLDSAKKKYNVFPCSFFENRVNQDMDAFFADPNVHGVRYYFGYDNSPTYQESNRIRVIFVGVDEAGRNILSVDDPDTKTAQLLQNSWPPPPPPYT